MYLYIREYMFIVVSLVDKWKKQKLFGLLKVSVDQ